MYKTIYKYKIYHSSKKIIFYMVSIQLHAIYILNVKFYLNVNPNRSLDISPIMGLVS